MLQLMTWAQRTMSMQHVSDMHTGTSAKLQYRSSTHLESKAFCCRGLLSMRQPSRGSIEKCLSCGGTVNTSSKLVAHCSNAGIEEVEQTGPRSQLLSQLPKRRLHAATPQHSSQLPAQRRLSPQRISAAAHTVSHQATRRHALADEQYGSRASSSPRSNGTRRGESHASAVVQDSSRAVQNASMPLDGMRQQINHPIHPRFQPYWPAARPGTLHGGAADGKHAWSEEEQRRLCKACHAAAVHQHPAEAVRMLQSQQLGMCIEHERLAWQLLKGVSQAPQASLRDSLRLLTTLRPFRGSLYDLLLSSLSKEKNARVERLGKVLDAMRADERIDPSAWDMRPWRQVLTIYERLGRAEEAQQVFDYMRKKGIWHPKDTLTFNVLLNALSRNSEAAFDRFVELKDLGLRADLVTYNTLLKACMRSANLPCAEVIMSQLRQHGLKGSEHTYNTMIKVASYAGNIDRALAVLEDMAEAGAAPTPAIWGSLLVACGKAGQVESAIAVWKRMQQEGAHPSTDNCNALLTACLCCQHNERGLTLFQQMRHLGVQPDTVTYNLALKACEAPANNKLTPGLLDTAFGLLHDMGESNVEPDLMTYTTLLGLCAQAGNGPQALALYEDIKSSGVRADTALLNALISALGSCGLAQDALAVFRTMVWGAARKRADQVTYRLMTRICREAGLIKEALHAYRGMRSCGFKPSNAEWREVIAAAVEAAMSGDGAITAQEVAECLGLKQGQQAVDLHGLSGLEARAAVLCVLSSVQQRAASGQPLEPDLTFITGVGRHSDPIQGPVLYETVRKLLNEELKLATDDARRPNQGCLVINRQTLLRWLDSRKHKAN